ncbi:hypothetical protein OE88DRAFT_1788223 [Heliocybe sulcata]|uniref:Uncharacterized protein n=2 Tax=Heliocybe sulcata TaxID=5364 RepID=A0A5C3NA70_9AGAM|nr:hypothetical protein OE88DRAFT_1788223 [Heliocybe sulcata]
MSSKPIKPLYEPSAPPPVLPRLLAQTDIFYHMDRRPRLLAEIDFITEAPLVADAHSLGVQRMAKVSRRTAPYSQRRGTPAHPRAATPYPQASNTALEADEAGAGTTHSGTRFALPNTGAATLIPKPRGEVNRISRGGYNLSAEMRKHGWKGTTLTTLKNHVHGKARELLDLKQTVVFQEKSNIEKVKQSALESFTDLQHFEDCWPVYDILKTHLKYESERASSKEKGKGRDKQAARITDGA